MLLEQVFLWVIISQLVVVPVVWVVINAAIRREVKQVGMRYFDRDVNLAGEYARLMSEKYRLGLALFVGASAIVIVVAVIPNVKLETFGGFFAEVSVQAVALLIPLLTFAVFTSEKWKRGYEFERFKELASMSTVSGAVIGLYAAENFRAITVREASGSTVQILVGYDLVNDERLRSLFCRDIVAYVKNDDQRNQWTAGYLIAVDPQSLEAAKQRVADLIQKDLREGS